MQSTVSKIRSQSERPMPAPHNIHLTFFFFLEFYGPKGVAKGRECAAVTCRTFLYNSMSY